MGLSWDFLGAVLGRSWGCLGLSAVLGRLGAVLALSRGCLGPPWASLGLSWGPVGAVLGLSCGCLGPAGGCLGAVMSCLGTIFRLPRGPVPFTLPCPFPFPSPLPWRSRIFGLLPWERRPTHTTMHLKFLCKSLKPRCTCFLGLVIRSKRKERPKSRFGASTCSRKF